MPQCEECGKQILLRAAHRIEKITGGRLLCRSCMIKQMKKDQPVFVCKDCGEPIEPQIARRLARARRSGIRPPRLCRMCFLKRQEPIHDAPDRRVDWGLKVGEWECVNCGAALEPNEITEIKSGQVIQCEYCGKAISREMFKR